MLRYNLKFHNFLYILLVLKEFTAMTTSIQLYSNIAANPKSNYCFDNLTKTTKSLLSIYLCEFCNITHYMHIMKQCNDGTVNSSPDKGQ